MATTETGTKAGGEDKPQKQAPLYDHKRMLIVLVLIALVGGMIQSREYRPPQWDGDTVISRFLGLQYTLPEGWEWDREKESEQAVEDMARTRDRHCIFVARSGESTLSLLMEKTTETVEDRQKALAQPGDRPLPGVQVAGTEFEGITTARGETILLHWADGYLLTIRMDLAQGEDANAVLAGFALYSSKK